MEGAARASDWGGIAHVEALDDLTGADAERERPAVKHSAIGERPFVLQVDGVTGLRRHTGPFGDLLDLDHFKQYNDTHGHLAGDRLLLSATAAWQSALRETDVLARWGGDEFVLLLPNCDLRQTEALIDRMRAICPTPFSAGIAESDDEP